MVRLARNTPGPGLAISELAARQLRTPTLEFGILEAGSGPLALCLHGFPDSAFTWRHLLPQLADAGFHAVAPYMRGYAPTEVPRDGCVGQGALIADAVAIHEALGGDEQAVLIGHDWGAATAYGAAAFAPERWRRIVGLSIPPAPVALSGFGDYEQLKRFFYMFFFQTPAAEDVVAAGESAFIDRLWADWSPGYEAGADLQAVKDCLRARANLSAALGYYRALLGGEPDPCRRYEQYAQATAKPWPQPTLYLHGERDGCFGVELVRNVEDYLPAGSRAVVIENAGHFLQLERPEDANPLILDWVSA